MDPLERGNEISSTMSPGGPERIVDAHWERLQDLFSRAIELPESEREAFITRETTSEADLREEVLDLLAIDAGRSSDPLTNVLAGALDTAAYDRRTAMVGRIIGNYELVAILGHGGTGTVYLGERADRQYSAQVAVKVIDKAIMQGDLGLRFRAERQILASLNHANIARLLDGGETDEGQPYLIMEYVRGEPVDCYCERQRLDLRARLELFLEICNAVQHAHQNLIVHRDLKPANILVTSEGMPKLLDFGIAKLLDTRDAAAALKLTRADERILTPEYASPEQILGRAVTTASDVYALGVVLYELLTGLLPHAVPAWASPFDLEHTICESDPQRPSTAVGRAMEDMPDVGQPSIAAMAAARGLTPDRLQRRLIGDIDAIVMRALRKEPQSRYGSVEQLAADIRRYFSAEPVVARQGNWLYYSQRFVRRHRIGVSAGSLFAIIIIAFAITTSVQNQRIAAERDKSYSESESARAVSSFMVDVFSAAEPYKAQGRQITARELLDEAGRQVHRGSGMRPGVRATLLASIGRAYRRSGDVEDSVTYLEDAVRLRKQMPDGGGVAAAEDMSELAVTLRMLGDFEGSSRVLIEAMTICDRLGQQRTPIYATLLINRGRLELDLGNVIKAQQSLDQALALNRQVRGPHDPEVAVVLMELSRLYTWIDDIAAVEKVTREAVEIFQTGGTPELHPDRVLAETRLAEALLLQGRINEAAPLFETSLSNQRKLFTDNSRQVAEVLDSLAQIRRQQGHLAETEDYAAQALNSQVNALGAEHSNTPYYRTAYARILIRRGKFVEAEQELRQSLDTLAKTRPADHQYVASAEHFLGELLLQTNRLDEAERVLSAAMNRWKRTRAPAWRSARSASALGEVLYHLGRIREAETCLTHSYRELAADDQADREARTMARERLKRFNINQGQRDDPDESMLATSRKRPPAGPT